VWDEAYARVLKENREPKVADQRVSGEKRGQKAA
jgi:hypothetical protein